MTQPHYPERSFGLSVGTVCALFAALSLWRGHRLAAERFGIAALPLVLLALLRPSFLAGPASLWAKLSRRLGWVNARVLLSVLFFIVLTPMAALLRISGQDTLQLRSRRGSGWVPYPERYRNPKHFERMY